MQILVLIGLYFLKCTKFDQLILMKIIKIVATRCQILTLKCTKIDFGWGSAPAPAGGAYNAPPDLLAGFKGPTSKGRGGREGEAWDGRWVEGEGGEEGGRGGRDGLETPCDILNTPLVQSTLRVVVNFYVFLSFIQFNDLGILWMTPFSAT